MKTQGVSLGPQLLSHASSFNLHCLSKGCGCVHTPKNSSTGFKARENKGMKAISGKQHLNPPEMTEFTEGNRPFFVGSKLEQVPLWKGSWTPGKFQGILILFFYRAHKTEPWFKGSHQNTLKRNTHTTSDYFSLCKIKTSWRWGRRMRYVV